jgi:hypothetical protein
VDDDAKPAAPRTLVSIVYLPMRKCLVANDLVGKGDRVPNLLNAAGYVVVFEDGVGPSIVRQCD